MNIPLIFAEFLIIIQDGRDDIRRTILQLGESLGLIVEVLGFPEDSDDFGTPESLRIAYANKKITVG